MQLLVFCWVVMLKKCDQCLSAAAGALLLLRAVVLPLSLIFYTTAGDKFVLV